MFVTRPSDRRDSLEGRRAPREGDRGVLDTLEDGVSTARLAAMLAAAALGAAALVAILAG